MKALVYQDPRKQAFDDRRVTIVRYSNGHQDTPFTVLSTPETDIGTLEAMQEILDFEGDELQRMEDEGGIPLNDNEAARVDAYFKVSQCIRALLRTIRLTFTPTISS